MLPLSDRKVRVQNIQQGKLDVKIQQHLSCQMNNFQTGLLRRSTWIKLDAFKSFTCWIPKIHLDYHKINHQRSFCMFQWGISIIGSLFMNTVQPVAFLRITKYSLMKYFMINDGIWCFREVRQNLKQSWLYSTETDPSACQVHADHQVCIYSHSIHQQLVHSLKVLIQKLPPSLLLAMHFKW